MGKMELQALVDEFMTRLSEELSLWTRKMMMKYAVDLYKVNWNDFLKLNEGRQYIDTIYLAPKITGKGFWRSIKLKEGDLAYLPPLRIIGITTKGDIIVTDDSVKGQGGRSVPVKGTNGVGKGPNDELTHQHPDPHTRGTGRSTVEFGKIQVRKNVPNNVIWTLIFLFNQLSCILGVFWIEIPCNIS